MREYTDFYVDRDRDCIIYFDYYYLNMIMRRICVSTSLREFGIFF